MKKINMVDLNGQYRKIRWQINREIKKVIKSSYFINGPVVKEFQNNLQNYLNVRHVIPCANGTDALQIALMALDLERGDEVITTNFSFASTIEVILLLGLKPVIVDIDSKTFNIDPSMRNELLDLYKVLSPFKEVPEVLKSLKEKKFKLAILSNGTPALLNELIKNNNLDNIFDDLFSIEQVGIYKPDSKVYDMPIRKYNIEKNEIAFLSANTWDVSGGGNYGYQSIWVNRNNNIFDNLDYKPNNQVKNLSELIDLI